MGEFSAVSGRGDGVVGVWSPLDGVVGVWSPLDGVGPARGRRAGGSGRPGALSRAGAPQRLSFALGLLDHSSATRSTSGGATEGGPGQRVLAVTRVRSNHCEDPAAFRTLPSVRGVGPSVLGRFRGPGAPAPSQYKQSLQI